MASFAQISTSYLSSPFFIHLSHTQVIGRMYTAAPNQGERFYLRLLLLHVPKATSFQDLRTVNGEVFDSFKAAALALELLEDDNVWIKCIEEAATVQMPAALRYLFTTLLEFCELKDVRKVQ